MLVTRHKLFEYHALFEILELKQGSIYKTKFLGHIHQDDEELLLGKYGDSERYVLSSVSTSYSGLKQDLVNLPMHWEKGVPQ